MPRSEQKIIQLTIDGREVNAPEGMMLVDAAKHGDIEIPYFCYQPKLGPPVGACRMCLVEIEGIPKLQTSCSTPVKDGMVVHTQTERVHTAQNAVVEFLLVNHPLDCPVCDKGGECPLQDITFGWGLGKSRFVEPKRHFVKPLSLSPLIAIDRERCILCYRCVRFSQEIAEDYQLIFAERGADTFVSTHDGHPYVAPFSGNIVELCPVGALTSKAYRFRARPWDIEGAGAICMLCPSQCNVELTVRDEKVTRVSSRDPFNEDVDDGWLCDKGRFAYQSIHVDDRITAPLARDGGELRTVSWERALETAAGLTRHERRVGALVGGQATNEEGFLIGRLLRERLGSGDLDCRVGGSADLELARSLTAPDLQATVPDLEYAHTVLVVGCELLDEAPILDLRIRKGVRRRGVQLAVVSARPSALDAGAKVVVRCEPGEEATFLHHLASELVGEARSPLARLLREGGEDVVIVYGERLDPGSLPSLLLIAQALGLADHQGAGLLEIPAFANGRGLREAGVLPVAGPGYGSLNGAAGRGAGAIAQAAADGEITALYLFESDPLRDQPDGALWRRALDKASLVVAHASVLTEGLRENANVVFPADTYAEKEGTVVHPDGRLQRLRTAVGHPNEVRPGWWVVSEVAKRCGLDLGVLTSSMAFRQLVGAVPFYAGLTLEEIGGRGVRWPAREAAAAMPKGGDAGAPAVDAGRKLQIAHQTSQTTSARDATTSARDATTSAREAATSAREATTSARDAATSARDATPENGAPTPGGGPALRLGLFRPIWAAPEVEISPILRYTIARQQAELSPEDARQLGVSSGDDVVISQNGTSVTAPAVVRSGVPEGTVFLATGLEADSGNGFAQAAVEVRPA